jgi:hypothetical protein
MSVVVGTEAILAVSKSTLFILKSAMDETMDYKDEDALYHDDSLQR